MRLIPVKMLQDKNGVEYLYDAYPWVGGEWGEFLEEIKPLYAYREEAPPWNAERVGDDLYRRRLLNWGMVWYTFIRANDCCICFLVGTCERVDGNDEAVIAARQQRALELVDELRQQGRLCSILQ